MYFFSLILIGERNDLLFLEKEDRDLETKEQIRDIASSKMRSLMHL